MTLNVEAQRSKLNLEMSTHKVRVDSTLTVSEVAELVDGVGVSAPKRSLGGETNMQRYWY